MLTGTRIIGLYMIGIRVTGLFLEKADFNDIILLFSTASIHVVLRIVQI